MRISRINFNLYKTFAEVYETKNLSSAAINLGLTQPTITYNIKELEKQLKVRLFNSNSRGAEPTAYADELYPLINNAFSSLFSAEDTVQILNDKSQGKIKINISPYFVSHILSKHISAFSKQYPNIRFEIQQKFHDDSISSLSKQDADLILCTSLNKEPLEKESRVSLTLKELTNVFFSSKDFAEQNKLHTKISKKQLDKIPVITLKKPFVIGRELENMKIINNPFFEVETTEIMTQFAKHNLGIGYCIKEYFDSSFDESFMKFEITDMEMPKFFLSCSYNKNLSNKAAIAFISCLKKEFKVN